MKNSVLQWEQTFTYDRYGNRNFNETETTFDGFLKQCSGNTVLCSALKKRLNPTIDAENNRLDTDDEYNFDGVGNTTATADGRTYVYDGENKQVETVDDSTTLGKYWYDGEGRRIKKFVPGMNELTIFVYDAMGRLIQEHSTIVANPTNAQVEYLTNDPLGSPRVNTGRKGKVVSRHDYHPFGEGIVTDDRDSDLDYEQDMIRKQFTGYERDSETGLDFAQARYFAIGHGRFFSPDPLYFQTAMAIDPQQFNLYGYTRNNPLKWVDPTGEKLHVRGNISWLLSNIFYGMVGGQEVFEKYFEITNGQVVTRDVADFSKANEGVMFLKSVVDSAKNYLYFAGGDDDSETAARLVGNSTNRNGRLNTRGLLYRDNFLGYTGPGMRGITVLTEGRQGYSPIAALSNGDPVFCLIAFNYDYYQSNPVEQYGVNEAAFAEASRPFQEASVGKIVDPVRIFIHETGENLAFEKLTPYQPGTSGGYDWAHKMAIYRERRIAQELKLTGGFAGGAIRRISR